MENTYLSEIPEELYIIILSYLPHDDIYKLTEHRDIHPMDIFILNYNELHIIIKKFPNYYSAIDWDVIFDDMKHIEYNKLIESLNDDSIEFNIEDKLNVISFDTFNIIYTYLLRNEKFLLEVIHMMNEAIYKSDYHSLYIYLYIRKRAKLEDILERIQNNPSTKNIELFLIGCAFMAARYELLDDIDKFRKIANLKKLIDTIFDSFHNNREKVEGALKNSLNGDYFYKLFTYFISD